MQIRRAQQNDIPQINDIHNWHSENGVATFIDPTSLEERQKWFHIFLDNPKHILLVAEEDGRILGFAGSFTYRGGGVFKDTLETSIYLRSDQTGKGLGRQLYAALFDELKDKGVHRIVVGIGLPNAGSVALHRKMGFTEIGTFDEYAFYKGAYRSSLWMQKKFN